MILHLLKPASVYLLPGVALLAQDPLPSPEGLGQYALAGMVVVAVGALRLVEASLAAIGRKGEKSKPSSTFMHTDRGKLDNLHDWHAPDSNGTQPWKNPEVRELLGEIRDTLRDLLAEERRRGGS